MDKNKTWVSSDLHLGHANILKFESTAVPGYGRVRKEFDEDAIDEMNEKIIENHNSVVGTDDVWYCLGDLLFGMKNLDTFISRLNGRKKYLIIGNHEYREKSDFVRYFDHFRKISESCRFGNVIFTHRPVLLGSWEAHLKANVHGHIHEANVPDQRYINVGMEQINYIPVSMAALETSFKERGIDVDFGE